MYYQNVNIYWNIEDFLEKIDILWVNENLNINMPVISELSQKGLG